MTDLRMNVTPEEREFLITLLDEAMKEKLIEEHRTKTPSYRDFLVCQEKTMRSLLAKLRQAAE